MMITIEEFQKLPMVVATVNLDEIETSGKSLLSSKPLATKEDIREYVNEIFESIVEKNVDSSHLSAIKYLKTANKRFFQELEKKFQLSKGLDVESSAFEDLMSLLMVPDFSEPEKLDLQLLVESFNALSDLDKASFLTAIGEYTIKVERFLKP